MLLDTNLGLGGLLGSKTPQVEASTSSTQMTSGVDEASNTDNQVRLASQRV